jgi:hypothetical protein
VAEGNGLLIYFLAGAQATEKIRNAA